MTAPSATVESIQAYLGGRLSDAASRAFEERLPRDPALVRAMEDTLKLREGLEVLRERGELATLVRGPRRVRSQLAFAAALAAGIASVAVFLGLQLLARAPIVTASIDAFASHSGAASPVAARFTFAAMRQASASPDFVLPASGVLELRVLAPGAEPNRNYRATLTLVPEAAPVATIGAAAPLLPDPDGFVTLYADAARLEPGDYALSVTPESGEVSAVTPFRFHLRRAAGTATETR